MKILIFLIIIISEKIRLDTSWSKRNFKPYFFSECIYWHFKVDALLYECHNFDQIHLITRAQLFKASLALITNWLTVVVNTPGNLVKGSR